MKRLLLTAVLGLCVMVTYGRNIPGFADFLLFPAPVVGPITGTSPVCVGNTFSFSDATSGGSWSSSNSGVASVSPLGVVSGSGVGTAVISYSVTDGTGTTVVTYPVTVGAATGAISGATSVCTGSSTLLGDAGGTGTWTSSDSTIANIGSTTGELLGIGSGVATITFTKLPGCYRFENFTVNPTPSAIIGANTVCIGATNALTDALIGGTWTSSNTLTAAVGSNTGVVTGEGMGFTLIHYTMSTGCVATMPMTINPSPVAISGTLSVCAGSLISLSDVTSSGVWSSGNPSVAAVGSGSGFVTGESAGTAAITYQLATTGCFRTANVTVNPLPAAISGTTQVCVGQTTHLSDTNAGGAWSSSSTALATISTAGIVTGVSAGTPTISYKLPTGCLITTPITVNPLPSAITGTAKVCVGATTTLIDTSAGGTWSTLSGLASLDGSGNVAGISAGTAVVTYTSALGCYTTKVVTVNALPPAISGTLLLCQGATTTFTDITTGGTWTSSDGTEAVISGTGFVAAVGAGNPMISYQLPATGCITTATMTINPLPSAITGVASMCDGTGTILSDVTPGGTWSSSNAGVASIDGTGAVTSGVAGTATISYSLATGCRVTKVVTVNILPTNISGTPRMCVGTTTSLSDATSGGTWSSGDMTIAAISVSGVVSGISAATTTISYTLGTGCATYTTVTVNPLPPAITGTTNVCIGLSSALTDASGSGFWSSSNTGVGTVDGTGNVTGVAAGSTTIIYTLPTGCKISTSFVVNGIPPAILGNTSLCMGASGTLSDVAGGGAWSSSNLAVANITGTGTVITVAPGTTTITYTSAAGCVRTTTAFINETPGAVIGYSSICAGSPAVFSDTTAGGSWSSSYPTVLTIGSGSGVATAISVGFATITYKLASGCMATKTMTVTPGPAGISGAGGICAGNTVTLLDPTGGGTWTSANPAVGTIGSGTGTFVAISAGTTGITYQLSASCQMVTTMTVNQAPSAITGTTVVCSGLTTALTDAVTTGTWVSSYNPVATVGAGTGVVTGGAGGTANITYTLGDGCRTMTTVTVNALPAVIIGTLHVCDGLMTSLSDGTTGGVWNAGAPGNVSIDGSGFVTGLSAGTNGITYTLGTGCVRTAVVTVNPLPPAITGPSAVCSGLTTTLSDATTGGTWSSSNLAIAGVSPGSGVVTGVANGTATITYKISTGCVISTIVTVEPLPSPISGLTSVCVGSSVTLTEAAGGTWSSSNTAVATIDASGSVAGVSAGTTMITYALGTGCIKTILFTVHPLPLPINGASAVCAGSTTMLTDASVGGTWSSDNLPAAIISAGGMVTGINLGSTHIIYTLPTGCTISKTLIVNPLPAEISGTGHVCAGLTTSLSDATSGGTWVSTNITVATIGSGSGLVSGHVAGTSVVTYTAPTGCRITTIVTVNSLPGGIGGVLHVCQNAETPLNNSITGGTWSSSNPAVGSIGITSGMAFGVTPGTTTITYTIGTGCLSSAVLTVNPSPAAIAGSGNVCAGSTMTLSDATTGGSWASGSGLASVGSGSGVVTGISAGTVLISYSLAGGCRSILTVTVAASPTAIYGTKTVCAGSITSLTDPLAGGTWVSSAPGVATVALTSGNVSGVAAGTATITYTVAAGCFKTAIVTVNPSPTPIAGNTIICMGSTSALSDAVAGGTWTTSSFATAPITSAGVVTGALNGIATITYSLGAGCKATATITVNISPYAITGPTIICIGSLANFSDPTPGGTWISSNPSAASIGLASGGALGLASGTTTITYTLSSGCSKTKTVTVDPIPAAITLGTDVICSGTTITLSDTPTGGRWSSNNTAVATVGSITGIVSGISGGMATITYNLASGCTSLLTLTVNQSPAAIIGPANVCIGASIFLSDVTAGGTWHASNAFGTIDGIGNVTGVTPGKDTFSYVVASGCKAVAIVSVNASPIDVTGDAHVCTGSTTTLSDASLGGHWFSSDVTVATVGSGTGIVGGVSIGVATITYSLSSICNAVTEVTVTQMPSVISGTTHFCVPQSETFTDVYSGGIWSSSDPGVAFASPVSGLITAVAGGTATISYTLPGGCVATREVTIAPMAVAGTIGGYSSVCISSTIQLTDAAYGGVWSGSDPTVAYVNPTNGMVTGLAVGNDTITYTVTQYCSTEMTTWPITVGPEVILDEITGNNTICQYGTDTMVDASPGGIWTSTNLAKATIDASGVLTAVGYGLDTIVYTVFSGCAAVKRASVIIDELPTNPQMVVHPGASVCANSQYMNIGVGLPQPVGFTYTWGAINADINSISQNKQNVLVSFPTAGAAMVTLTSQFQLTGCAISDTFVTNVSSSESSASGISYSAPTFTCTDNSADSYQWGYDNGYTLDSSIIPGETSQTYNQSSPDFTHGYYWVMTLHGDCLQKAYYVTPPSVNVAYTSVEHLEFILFPNPADSKVFIDVKGLNSNSEVRVKLIDMLGKEITGCQLISGKGSIDVSGLAQGVYSVVLVKDGMKLGARTFVKN